MAPTQTVSIPYNNTPRVSRGLREQINDTNAYRYQDLTLKDIEEFITIIQEPRDIERDFTLYTSPESANMFDDQMKNYEARLDELEEMVKDKPLTSEEIWFKQNDENLINL